MTNFFLREEMKTRSPVKLREIPPLVTPLKISQMNYSHNDIRNIPPHISSAINLQILDLSHNKISKIEFIFTMKELKYLNMSHNLICEIPNELIAFRKLQHLDLSFNRITILNNIRVIKQLTQIILLEEKSYIQVNLQGNQILKKKGCRDIYNKWMNPVHSDLANSRQIMMNMTKKRNSKSLEMPFKDSSAIQTNRNYNVSLNKPNIEKTNQLQNSKKYTEYKQEASNLVSPNFPNSQELQNNSPFNADKNQNNQIKSKILNTTTNFRQFSGIQQSCLIADSQNLGEWFCICIDNLNELSNNFSIVTSNQDINGLQNEIRLKIVEESCCARQLIHLSLEVIKLSLNCKLTKTLQNKYLSQISIINQKIKINHKHILKQFAEKQYLPIRFYKPWVNQFRKLRQIIAKIPIKIATHQANQIREQQIQELINISPDKQQILPIKIKSYEEASHQPESDDKHRLSELLFSKNKDKQKQDCLLLSEQKGFENSQKKQHGEKCKGQECDNCIMIKWQNNRAKQQLQKLQQKVQNMQRQKQKYLQKIQLLQKFKDKYTSISCKQELIIEELGDISPSTYQHILLQQAKTIQYMINAESSLQFQQLRIDYSVSKSNQKMTAKHSQKDKQGIMNTRLSSNKQRDAVQSNRVSEFCLDSKNDMITKQSSNTVKGSSYFKNRNIITTVNRTDEDPKTQAYSQQFTTEGNQFQIKQGRINQKQIVVSQFNSQVNSLNNSQKKQIDHIVASKQIFKKQDKRLSLGNAKSLEKSKGKRSIKQKSQKTQKSDHDVILISEASQLKKTGNSKNHQSSINDMNNKLKITDYIKSEEIHQLLQQKLTSQKLISKEKKYQWPTSMKNLGKTYEIRGISPPPRKQSKHQRSGKQNINPQRLKRNKTSQKLDQSGHHQYKSHPYLPMQSKEGERYKKYVQYHLRNNIIEILCKKNNNAIDAQILNQKYNYINKGQKLINKKLQISQDPFFGDKSIGSEINKTFR